MAKTIEQALTFDDVLLVPKYSDIEHRADVDISSYFMADFKLEKPFISANMDSVTEHKMAFAMAEHGGLGILHRYLTIDQMLLEIEAYNKLISENTKVKAPFVVSIGVHDEDRYKQAYAAGVRHFCIDVAHGHHSLVKGAIENLRSAYGDEVGIVAGNTCTYEGALDLFTWGADTIKVGVGPGSVCTTRLKTGAGYPQLTAVMLAHKARKDFASKNPDQASKKFIIADGGIKNYGDVTKAVAAGADTVMMGSIFAGCKQTPGIVWRNEREEMIKSYRGMASQRAQHDFGMDDINEEGIALTVKYKGNIKHILERLLKGLRSGMSYSGARTIPELQEKADFIQITASGVIEGQPHKSVFG